MGRKKTIYGKDVRGIFRSGGSLAVALPPEYIKAHKLKAKMKMDVLFNDELHLKPVDKKEIKKYFEKERK